MSKKKVLVIAGLLYLLLNVVILPRRPHFQCGGNNGGPYAEQFGFPFVYLQRSVSPSACIIPGNATPDQADYYATHHIHAGNFVADVAIGALILAGINTYVLQKPKGKHRG